MKSRYLVQFQSARRPSFSMFPFAMLGRAYTRNVFNFMNNVTLSINISICLKVSYDYS